MSNKRYVYSPEEEKVFNLLTITGKYRVVGSQMLPHLKYKSDFDLQEYFQTPNVNGYPKKIWELFKNKFVKASKDPNLYITDFKCGEDDKKEPLRWNKQNIKKGFQTVNGKKYLFTDCILQKATMKMDIIAFIDGVATEFTENYFFKLNGFQNYKDTTKEEISKNLTVDGREYLKKGNVLKALKRVNASLRLSNTKPNIQKLIEKFLNSPTGFLNAIKNDIDTLKTLTETKFKKVDREKIKENISLIQRLLEDVNDKKLRETAIKELESVKRISIKHIPDRLDEVREYLQQRINRESNVFVNKHSFLKSLF
tara:strand:+ start:733 stop:1665 length:933 start_codon:yes stop_codon:yes gene_type:complete